MQARKFIWVGLIMQTVHFAFLDMKLLLIFNLYLAETAYLRYLKHQTSH
jgi:hypothetical protein